VRPTVLLFDIDGTLVDTGGAGRRAMVGAFEEIYGRTDVFDGVKFAGMTDRAIARHGVAAARHTCDDEAIDCALETYLRRLEAEVARSERYRVLPGVEAVLAWLAAEAPPASVAVGLGTGNVRRGAYTKLARGGIDTAFPFGGFGCDAEDRSALLRRGAERGAERLGASVEACRIVVIGDTPKDVAAALAIGAECLGVGSGPYTAQTLIEAGAQHAVDTLEEPRARDVLLR
jgi:phosphoglycolate phosphatase-like HAD superfamily hydrolase